MTHKQIQSILHRKGVKYYKMDILQNRTIIRIPKVSSLSYQYIVYSFYEVANYERVFVKMDLKALEIFWLFITGRRYSTKNYTGA